jgi:hypothetical protein
MHDHRRLKDGLRDYRRSLGRFNAQERCRAAAEAVKGLAAAVGTDATAPATAGAGSERERLECIGIVSELARVGVSVADAIDSPPPWAVALHRFLVELFREVLQGK